MFLAIIAGNASDKLKDNITKFKDNIDIITFKDFDDYIGYVEQRSISVDRVIIYSSKLNYIAEEIKGEIQDFAQYMKTNSTATRIIMILNKDENSNVYSDNFNEYFFGVNYAILPITDKFTTKTLTEAVIEDTKDICKNYSINTKRNVSIDIEVVEDIKKEVEIPKQEVADLKPKKKGFLSVFRSKKEDKNITEIKNANTKENENSENIKINNMIPKSINNTNETSNNDNIIEEFYTENDNLQKNENNLENENSIEGEQNYDENNNEEYINKNTSENTEILQSNISDKNQDNRCNNNNIEYKIEEGIKNEEVLNSNSIMIVMDDTDEILIEDESFDRENLKEIKEVEKVVEKVIKVEVEKLVEVEKIVEKVVEVEKLVVINKGNNETKLDKLKKGDLVKKMIFTGNRNSGVTSTALQVAYELSKTNNVLYVDFDTEYHGILNYIKYSEFIKYNNLQKSGIFSLKAVKNLSESIIRLDNINYIISDYGVDINNQDIVEAQNYLINADKEFTVIIYDVPVYNMKYIEDSIIDFTTIFIAEPNLKSYMELLCNIESLDIKNNIKKILVNKSVILFNTNDICNKNTNSKLKEEVLNRVEFDNESLIEKELYTKENNLTKILNVIMEV